MKPVLLVGSIAGIFPVQLETGEFKFFSWRLIYTAIVYLASVSLGTMYVPDLVLMFTRELNGRFVSKTAASTALSAVFFMDIMPLISMFEIRTFETYIKRWHLFEEHYNEVTNVRLNLLVYRRTLVLFSVTVLFLIYHNILRIIIFPTNTVFDWLGIILGTYYYAFKHLWTICLYLSCYILSMVATNVLQNFRKDIRRSLHYPLTVQQYCSLWNHLCVLVLQMGSTFSYTFIGLILYTFLSLTLNTYMIIIMIRERTLSHLAMSLTHILSDSVTLFTLCNIAHSVSRKVRQGIEKQLEYIEFYKKDSVTEEAVQYMLLKLHTFPPDIKLGNFITVNRNLLASMLAMLVTYMVVLVQFDISLSSEEGETIECVLNNASRVGD